MRIDSQRFYSSTNRSQSFGLEFAAPELVVVGMQSDGKSSFIEALLGFQFNIVETSTIPVSLSNTKGL